MKTVKLMVAALAVLFAGGARAQVIEITTDTVVTDDNVSLYEDAEVISILAGATLTFKDLTANATFKATLTGGGIFAVDGSAASLACITFDGDATEFAGSFSVKNRTFIITKPEAVGSASFVYKFSSTDTMNDKSFLRGPGRYTCPMDISCSSKGNYGVFLDEGVELSAPVAYRTGRVNGPGTVSGLITIDKTIYVANGLRIAGDVVHSAKAKPTDSILGDGSPYVIAGPLSNIPMLLIVKSTVSFDDANLLDPEQVITTGGSASQTGTYDLKGFDQRAGSFQFKVAPKTDADRAKNILTSTTDPATLSLLSQNESIDFTGVVNDHLSLCVAGSGVFTLCGANNTTDGSLIASNGFLTVAESASFGNLSNLVVKGTGKLTVNSASVNPGQVDVEFDDAGTIDVKEGLTLEVNHALVDGVYLDPDTYTGDSGPLAGRLTGTLKVSNGAPVIEGKTYTWVGGTADDAMTVDENWKEGVAPSFNGRERLVFGTEAGGSQRAVVLGESPVYALEIDVSRPFALEAANGNARIQLGAGGLLVTNRLEDISSPNTAVVSCPIALSVLPQDWIVSTGAILENAAPLSSDETSALLTISSPGQVLFHADNSNLLAPMELKDLDSKNENSQPYVNHRYGLGAPSRFTTINAAWPRFEKPASGEFTNSTPLRVSAAPSNKCGSITLTNYADHYWQEGAVNIVGSANCNLIVYGYCHFVGGITNEEAATLMVRVQKREFFLEGSPIVSTKTFSTDYANTIHLNVAGNTWGLLGILKSTVHCGVAGALDPKAEIRLGSNNASYFTDSMAILDLGGFNQSCARLYRQWNPWATGKAWGTCFATVTSASPAILEVTSSVTDSVPIKVEGMAGVRFNGVGRLAFTNFVCSTTGSLEVARGTVKMELGASWANTTNVVVGADGRLELDAGTADTAFGPSAGSSAAVLRVAEGGRLTVAAGETATVRAAATVVGGEDKFLEPGTYGGEGAGLDAAHTLPWIEGGGSLRVLKYGGKSGVMIIIR